VDEGAGRSAQGVRLDAYAHLVIRIADRPASFLRPRAVAEHGAAWEKVEQTIGRMAGDCRDRYRNHLEHNQGRLKGPSAASGLCQLSSLILKLIILSISAPAGSWKDAEEELLTRLVLEARDKMAAADDKDSDVFWGEISKQMDYKRSRQQCRTKWCVVPSAQAPQLRD
jgi:hypothetical protein